MNNREFKFRVWDIDRKRFTKTAFVAMDSINIKMTLDGKLTWECEYGNGEVNGIIQQVTVLKDSKEVRIYEGDIVYSQQANFPVNTNHKIFSAEVRFGNGRFYASFKSGLYEVIDLLETQYTDLKVIGNIFENPELLK